MTYRRVSSNPIAAFCFSLIFMALSAAAMPAFAQGLTGLSVSVGADYTVGDYGSAADTKILTIPLKGRYEIGPWALALTIPYIRVDGPGDVVGGGDGAIVTKKGKRQGITTSTVHSGLGDIVAGVSYALLSGPAIPTVDLTGKVKFPTADESKNLGTGEFDYTVLVDAMERFGPIVPYGSIGYRFVGDPAGVDLNNQVLLSLGASVDLSRELTAGLAFDYRTSTTDEAEDPAELSPYLTWKLAPAVKLNVYSVFGLSDGSPNYGGGLQLVLAP